MDGAVESSPIWCKFEYVNSEVLESEISVFYIHGYFHKITYPRDLILCHFCVNISVILTRKSRLSAIGITCIVELQNSFNKLLLFRC